jgi:hypothetical protein
MKSTITDELVAINGFSLADARAALKLARLNHDSVRPEARPELERRMIALKDRIRRLNATQRKIDRENLALRVNALGQRHDRLGNEDDDGYPDDADRMGL